MNDKHSSSIQEYNPPTPPHSIETEQAVLGCMLKFPDATLTPCIGSFTQDFFYDPRHRALFELLLEMFGRNESVDLVTVGQRITDKNQIEEVGGSEYVRKLHDSVSTSANLGGYLNILQQKYSLRRMFETCTQCTGLLSQPADDADVLLDECERAMQKIGEVGVFGFSPHSMKELIRDVISFTADNSERMKPWAGISTGFAELDQLIGGCHKGEVVVIAGGSFETSAFAMNAVEHIVMNQKLPVGFFSLKLTAQYLTFKLVSSRARVDLQKMETGKLSTEDISKLTAAAEELTDAPLFIDDAPRLAILQLRARTQRMLYEHNIKLVVIDCLQLVTPTLRQSKDGQQEIAAVWKGILSMAREFHVPVVVLSRPNSQIESPDGKSQLSDLQESGIMGTGAGWVALLRKPANENGTSDDVTDSIRVDLLVTSERRGIAGKVPLVFSPGCGRFESVVAAKNDLPSE